MKGSTEYLSKIMMLAPGIVPDLNSMVLCQ